MKKIILIGTVLLFAMSCGKENILWIDPLITYNISEINLKQNPGSNNTSNEINNIFPGMKKSYFKKNYLGRKGDGYIKVLFNEEYIIKNNYVNNNYTYFNYELGVYENFIPDWSTYTTFSREREIEFRFDWEKISQSKMKIIFSSYQKQYLSGNIFSILNGEYKIKKETRKFGTAFAEIISLESDDATIVLYRE